MGMDLKDWLQALTGPTSALVGSWLMLFFLRKDREAEREREAKDKERVDAAYRDSTAAHFATLHQLIESLTKQVDMQNRQIEDQSKQIEDLTHALINANAKVQFIEQQTIKTPKGIKP